MTAKIIDFKTFHERKINQEIEDHMDMLLDGDMEIVFEPEDGLNGTTFVANFEELEGVRIILHFDDVEDEEENG